ncbi:hypothetical protein PUN28_012394 [Cardiocondyla obscurior]|uniref:Uncharacterized protein n=1 Tax=Cardiocondyla obscurior TaxID=286306 RepID=A0AAW2FGH4_9HYME
MIERERTRPALANERLKRNSVDRSSNLSLLADYLFVNLTKMVAEFLRPDSRVTNMAVERTGRKEPRRRDSLKTNEHRASAELSVGYVSRAQDFSSVRYCKKGSDRIVNVQCHPERRRRSRVDSGLGGTTLSDIDIIPPLHVVTDDIHIFQVVF